jgi:hypothetical protein
MNLGKINLITPPDSLFNLNPGYLLVKPSNKLKVQFQTILSVIEDDINVYIYDTDEVDIAWMLNAANNVDTIIVDIDNCDSITKNFVSVLLSNANAFYMTDDETTPWGLLSKNRIYNLDWIVEAIKKEKELDEEHDEDIDEG